ncbi:MAG TPA: RluA family pseudouridine synthase [Syntrophomonadaceae bacterium]|nr:RluA family pseudouridine synthase [Syntrophomonadaceae bacterium]
MEKTELLWVEEEMEGERLDAFLAEQVEALSRTLVQILIRDAKVTVNGSARKSSYHVQAGDEIYIVIPDLQKVEIVPQDLPLEIIYEDSDLVVVNKPRGMVVHPAHGNWDGTLVNALLYHIHDLSGINGELRPGIVHRLDKDTSGVIVVAKNDHAHRSLAEQIREHSIEREYIALVHDRIQENLGSIEAPIGRSKSDRKKMAVVADGRPATSEYQVLERFFNYTLVKVKLLTGRTHQIRVHFAYIKHPVVGDPLYGPVKQHLNMNTQALHAFRLGFQHPSSGEYIEFQSPLPDYFEAVLTGLRKEKKREER